MDAYGPWIQDPDYDEALVYGDDFRSDYLPDPEYGVGVVDYEGVEYIALTLGDLMGGHQKSMLNLDAVGGNAGKAGVHISWGWNNGTVGEENWQSMVRVAHEFRPWPVVPDESIYNPTAWPDGAVAIEWQDPANAGQSELLATILDSTTELSARNWDLTEGVNSGQPLTGPFVTKLKFTTGDQFGLWPEKPPTNGITVETIVDVTGGPDPVYRDLGSNVDLTSYLSNGKGWLYTLNDTFVEPRRDPGQIDGGNSQGPYTYGWIIDRLGLRRRYHPPVYRWVYEAPESTTYRRNFPRDDGLAGGAGRNFPRPRSVQGSNRIGGGYL